MRRRLRRGGEEREREDREEVRRGRTVKGGRGGEVAEERERGGEERGRRSGREEREILKEKRNKRRVEDRGLLHCTV